MTDYEFYYFLADKSWVLTFASLILTLILVFNTRVYSSVVWRVARLICAIGLLYVAVNLILHLSHSLEWWGHDAYHAHFPECALKQCEGERKIRNSGANYVFYLFFGWIPALILVGLCELGWRYRHRNRIKALEKRDAGYLFGSVLIFLALSIISIVIIMYSFEGIERDGLLHFAPYILGILFLILCVFAAAAV